MARVGGNSCYSTDDWITDNDGLDAGCYEWVFTIVRWDGNFVDGEKDGEWVLYYESGKVRMWERNYLGGKKEGSWVGYYENGNIKDEDIYEDGKCIEMCEGDE